MGEQMCDDAEKWLQEKEAEQAEIPGHEDAAFTAKDVVKKWEAIEKKLKILRRKPFLIPKVKKSEASKKSNSTATPEEGTVDGETDVPKTDEENSDNVNENDNDNDNVEGEEAKEETQEEERMEGENVDNEENEGETENNEEEQGEEEKEALEQQQQDQ